MTEKDYAAWQWRPQIVGAADAAYLEYGEDQGWSGIPPYEAVEAIIDIESGGDPNARNSTPMYNGQHATGLMQIVPGLSVTGAYESASGSGQVTEEQLYDPQTNLTVGIVGLAARAKDVQRTGWFGVQPDMTVAPPEEARGPKETEGPDWGSTIAIGWFGAGYQDGYGFWKLDEQVTDGPSGINGAMYRDRVNSYMAGFGPDSQDIATRGRWRDPSDPERKRTQPHNAWTQNQDGIAEWAFDFVEGSWNGVNGVVDGVKDALDIGSQIEAIIPRVAMIGAGIVLLVGGLVLVRGMAIGAVAGV